MADGLIFGNPIQFAVQAASVLAVVLYTPLVTFVILRDMTLSTALRVAEAAERIILDIREHGEQASTTGERAVLLLPSSHLSSEAVRPAPAVEEVGG